MKRNLLNRASALCMATTILASSTVVSGATTTQSTDDVNKNAVPEQLTKDYKGEKPNVIYILLDDMGYSDFGCYGSTVSTPNIDKLAADGLLYTDYYTQPISSPARAALLTGNEANTVGMGLVADVDFGDDVPNQNGTIYPEYGTIAQILGEEGYSTIQVGKWHLGEDFDFGPDSTKEQWPSGLGFDKNFTFVSSQSNQMQPGCTILGDEYVPVDYEAVEDYHFTTDMVDHSFDFIDEAKEENPDDPFFLYFATGAMHGPFNAPKEYIEKYDGKYDQGWDVEREKRYEYQLENGIIPEGTELSPRTDVIKSWDSLTADEQELAADHMETWAGFLEHTDMEIGRLIEGLKERGEYDNSIIVLTVDNGANSNGGANGSPNAQLNENLAVATVEEQLAIADQFGSAEYGTQYNKGWANASNTPFPEYKFTTFTGGLRVPYIIEWKDGIVEPGRIVNEPIDSADTTPTILDILGIQQPDVLNGVEQEQMEGNSFAETLLNDVSMVEGRDNEMLFAFANTYAYFDENTEYCLVRSPENETFLYNLKEDPTQQHDLKEEMPEKVAELTAKKEILKEKHNSQNLLTDIMQGVDKEIIIERYGYIAEQVYQYMEDGTIPTDAKAQRYLRMLNYLSLEVGTGYKSAGGTWYNEPGSPLEEVVYNYDTDDEMFFSGSAAQTAARSHTITATFDYNEGDEGVIFSNGGIDSGYVMYVKDGKVYYESNFVHDIRQLSGDLTPGKVEVVFTYDKEYLQDGVGTLYINGEQVDTGDFRNPTIFTTFDYFAVGQDPASRVSKAYEKDFNYPNFVDLKIELGDDLLIKNDVKPN